MFKVNPTHHACLGNYLCIQYHDKQTHNMCLYKHITIYDSRNFDLIFSVRQIHGQSGATKVGINGWVPNDTSNPQKIDHSTVQARSGVERRWIENTATTWVQVFHPDSISFFTFYYPLQHPNCHLRNQGSGLLLDTSFGSQLHLLSSHGIRSGSQSCCFTQSYTNPWKVWLLNQTSVSLKALNSARRARIETKTNPCIGWSWSVMWPAPVSLNPSHLFHYL